MTLHTGVEGRFYPADAKVLHATLDCLFTSCGGKPSVSTRFSGRVGSIIPHAGYAYSGRCAAHAYAALASLGRPDCVYILAPSHTGKGSAFTLQPFSTPLGSLRVENDIVNQLSKATGIPINDSAHASEHAIAVHIPFLRYVYGDVPIVPLVLDVVDVHMIAGHLANRSGLFIASSDFTHYGTAFDYLPFTADAPKRIKALDEDIFALIQRGDANTFIASVHKNGWTVCGAYPIGVLMALFGGKVRMVCHYSSADVTGDVSHIVDYVSAIFDAD